MLITDLHHDQLEAFIESAVTKALKKAIPEALLAHERQKYNRLGMTVDVTFYALSDSGQGYAVIQALSQMPHCPPLPGKDEPYVLRKDPDSDVQHFVVSQIVHAYKYITYESNPGVPEVVTEISVYLRRK